MGTSTSYNGPSDTSPLLPAWALPETTIPGTKDDEKDAGNQPANEDKETSDKPEDSIVDHTQTFTVPQANWKSAKIQLGKAISNRRGREGYKTASKAYVKARGGAKQAAQTSRSARSATLSFGRFLSDVGRKGLSKAMVGLGLEALVGQNACAVFAAILDAIAPEGKTQEEVTTRAAISEALANLLGEFAANETGILHIKSISNAAINSAIQECIVASAYNRFTNDLARQIEAKAITPTDAIRLERDIRQYMVDTVHLDFSGKDLLNLDWNTQGEELIDLLYEQAYRMIGGEE